MIKTHTDNINVFSSDIQHLSHLSQSQKQNIIFKSGFGCLFGVTLHYDNEFGTMGTDRRYHLIV